MPDQKPQSESDANANATGPPMPADGAGPTQAAAPLPPPPSFGRQMAQLVIIPAAIVIACLAMWMLFVGMAGESDDINVLLARLRQSGGQGKLAYGLNDPRYQERFRAAFNLPAAIEKELSDDDIQRRAEISKALVDVLDNHVAADEDVLRRYLLNALGRLGQPDGLERIIKHLGAEEDQVRYGAIEAISLWPDRDAAREAVPGLVNLLRVENPQVRIGAAAMLGTLADPGDKIVIDALHQVMDDRGATIPAVHQQAAIALAQLGDERGGAYVADLLLDRQQAAEHVARQLPADATDLQKRSRTDELLMATLAATRTPTRAMTHPAVWDKIKVLADRDPNINIRGAAKKLLETREQAPDTSTDGQ